MTKIIYEARARRSRERVVNHSWAPIVCALCTACGKRLFRGLALLGEAVISLLHLRGSDLNPNRTAHTIMLIPPLLASRLEKSSSTLIRRSEIHTARNVMAVSQLQTPHVNLIPRSTEATAQGDHDATASNAACRHAEM